MKILGQGRLRGQFLQEPDAGQGAGRLIAVDGGEQGNANRLAAVGTAKTESRQTVDFAANFKRAQVGTLD